MERRLKEEKEAIEATVAKAVAKEILERTVAMREVCLSIFSLFFQLVIKRETELSDMWEQLCLKKYRLAEQEELLEARIRENNRDDFSRLSERVNCILCNTEIADRLLMPCAHLKVF